MILLEATRLALESIRANALRSFLTLLGIIIGIAAIVTTASVINGLNLYVAEKLSNLGKGVFVISRWGIITSDEDWLRAARRNKRLKPDDARAIEQRCDLAEVVAYEVHARATLKRGDQEIQDVDVGGITAPILEIEPYDVEHGRLITAAEEEHAAAVVFVGHDIVEKLFPNVDPVGKALRIRNRDFEIVGAAAKKGSFFGMSQDTFVKIPFALHRKMWGTRSSLNISVKAADPALMEETMDQARAVLRSRHHLHPGEDDDFGIVSSEGINNVWKNMTSMIFNVAIFVVGISLVVGGIVIMNIMLVSVIERTREIGVRKAVGARQRDIVLQFLMESVILSLLGGLIGILVAGAAAAGLENLTPLPARFPGWAPPVAFGVCAAIGVFFGIHPARRAAHLNPIDALRAE
jgi:putative ABC transport system permease protein